MAMKEDKQNPFDMKIAFWFAKTRAKEYPRLPENVRLSVESGYLKNQSLDFYQGMLTALTLRGVGMKEGFTDFSNHIRFVSKLICDITEKEDELHKM